MEDILKLLVQQQQQNNEFHVQLQAQQQLQQAQQQVQQQQQQQQHNELQVQQQQQNLILMQLVEKMCSSSTAVTPIETAKSAAVMNIPSFPEFKEQTDEWELYHQRLLHHFQAIAMENEVQRCNYFLSWIGSGLYKVLQNLTGTKELTGFTFNELCSKLTVHYKKVKHFIIARHEFYQRRKQSSETHAQWISKLRGLATDCLFECPKTECKHSLVDEHIRDMVLLHTPDGQIRKRALSENNPSLAKISELALLFETTRDANQTLKSSEATSHAPVNHMKATYAKHRKPAFKNKRPSETTNVYSNKLKSCPGCHSRHQRSDCIHLKSTCRACGKVGHISTVCKGGQQKSAQSVKGYTLVIVQVITTYPDG